LGPRTIACSGLALGVLGCALHATFTQSRVESPYPYALAYGLVAAGCNGAYLMTIQFTQLFEGSARVLRVTLLPSCFKVASFVPLLLNIPQLSITTFFFALAVWLGVLAAISLFVFPDVAYTPGEVASVGWPSCKENRSVRDSLRATFVPVWHCRHELHMWLFVATFSWVTLVDMWAFGALTSHLLWPKASDTFYMYTATIVTNVTFLVAPFFARLIDSCGFRLAAIVTILVTQLAIVVIWVGAGVEGMEYVVTVMLLFVGATIFGIEFTYITSCFAPECFTGVVALCLFCQGVCGFVSWPLLAVAAPFGHDPSLGNNLFMLIPTCVLYAWPLWSLRPAGMARIMEAKENYKSVLEMD